MTAAWIVAALMAAPPASALVLEPDAPDVGATAKARVVAAVVEGLARRGLEPLSLSDVQGDSAEVRACAGDPECLRDAVAEAESVLVTSLGRVGTQWLASFSLASLRDNVVLGRSGVSAETLAALEDDIASAIDRLLLPEGTVEPSVSLPPEPRFVLLDVRGAGLSDGVARNLTQVVAAELRRIRDASVMSRSEVEAMLGVEQLRQVLDGQCDRSCFNRLAGALDADLIIQGQVGQLESDYVIQLSAIDQRSEGAARRHTETYRGSADELIRAMRHAVHTMFGLAHGTGGLAVSANKEGSRLFLDDAELGKLPLPPQLDLTPGRHVVRLEKSGFRPWRTDVYVNPETTSVLWAELEREPERWYQKWWVWTIVGTTVAGATAGIVAAATQNAPDTSQVLTEVEGAGN